MGGLDVAALPKTGKTAIDFHESSWSLIDAVGEMLWSKIKEPSDPLAGEGWKKLSRESAKNESEYDYRFFNPSTVPKDQPPPGVLDGSAFEYWYSQYVGSYRLESVPEGILRALP